MIIPKTGISKKAYEIEIKVNGKFKPMNPRLLFKSFDEALQYYNENIFPDYRHEYRIE